MGRAQRFYLCNLIPLWEIDRKHLEVDWPQENAQNGEVVEMRVDLDLNMQTLDFNIEFEIDENVFCCLAVVTIVSSRFPARRKTMLKTAHALSSGHEDS